MTYPLMEAILRCHVNPSCIDLNFCLPAAYDHVRRNDLVALLSEVHPASGNCHGQTTGARSNVEDIDKDGLVILEESLSLTFLEDNHLCQAVRLL